MKLLLILFSLFLISCASKPVFLGDPNPELESYKQEYIKEWKRGHKYHIGFHKSDYVTRGICMKGQTDEETEIMVNKIFWDRSSREERKKTVQFLMNKCYYNKYRDASNIYRL